MIVVEHPAQPLAAFNLTFGPTSCPYRKLHLRAKGRNGSRFARVIGKLAAKSQAKKRLRCVEKRMFFIASANR